MAVLILWWRAHPASFDRWAAPRIRSGTNVSVAIIPARASSDTISVNVGQTVQFKVTDTANAAYHIDIYRMGYYGGNGARNVATVTPSAALPQTQPAIVPGRMV